jgi:hypothetical protein
VTADDGVVYRSFSGKGLEFHPLAEFAALNGLAAAQDAGRTRARADALLARAIPSRPVWEYSFLRRGAAAVDVRHGRRWRRRRWRGRARCSRIRRS